MCLCSPSSITWYLARAFMLMRRNVNKGSIVERLCSDLIAKNRDINGLLYLYGVTRGWISQRAGSLGLNGGGAAAVVPPDWIGLCMFLRPHQHSGTPEILSEVLRYLTFRYCYSVRSNWLNIAVSTNGRSVWKTEILFEFGFEKPNWTTTISYRCLKLHTELHLIYNYNTCQSRFSVDNFTISLD